MPHIYSFKFDLCMKNGRHRKSWADRRGGGIFGGAWSTVCAGQII